MAYANPLRGNGTPLAEINITPLVDVMLTVLVIFMIATPIVTKQITLPLAGGDKGKVEPKVMAVAIGEGGELRVNDLPTSRAELEMLMHAASAGSAPVRLDIRPQAHSRYDDLAEVLAMATRQGMSDLRVEALPAH